MDRMACVDLPGFPLQLLTRRRPEWKARPVAVIDKDSPQGTILWVNQRARSCGIRRGMRYAAGLSLENTLHADTVPEQEIQAGIASMVRQLQNFSPDVEPHPGLPGTFCLDASGLEPLYGTLRRWAGGLQQRLRTLGFRSFVAVGFSRFGVSMAARSGPPGGTAVFDSPDTERSAAGKISIGHLPITPRCRDFLEKLGVRTIASFLRLPPGGIERRFGPEVHRLHRLADGSLWAPLHPLSPEAPRTRWADLERPETDSGRIAFFLEHLLSGLLEEISAKQEALRELQLHFRMEGEGTRQEQVRPASPTVDFRLLRQLIQLKLEAMTLSSGITRVRLVADTVPVEAEQLPLFSSRPCRNPKAADQALARVRARFGDDSVVQAKLLTGHLPEARFTWEPFDRIRLPRPTRIDGLRSLVRRIHARPRPLPPPWKNQRDGWLLLGRGSGPIAKMIGPYVISGGWWRQSIHREYHFALLQTGDLLWIYHDRLRNRWFLQGSVE